MPERRVVEVERVDFLVCVRPRARHGRWIWFDLADVPEEIVSELVGRLGAQSIRGARCG